MALFTSFQCKPIKGNCHSLSVPVLFELGSGGQAVGIDTAHVFGELLNGIIRGEVPGLLRQLLSQCVVFKQLSGTGGPAALVFRRFETVLAIAHRLSTIARMDRIIVLEDGRIVEQGTHDDLLAAKGIYARYWERQSGGFMGLTEAAE